MSWLLQQPLLHFLAVGGLLFGINLALSAPAPQVSVTRLTVTDAMRESVRLAETRRLARAPNAAELRAAIAGYLDQEVLFRRALELGLEHNNRPVEERLLQVMQFLGEGDGLSRVQVLQEARRLGLLERDPVVRRQLIESMKLVIQRAVTLREPSAEEVEAYYLAQRPAFRMPERVRMVHVFLSAARRGTEVHIQARRLLARLSASDLAPAQAVQLGDPFLHGNSIGPLARRRLVGMFGSAFAAALDGAEVGTWLGPVQSPYGQHLVWLVAREPAGFRPLSAVRNRVVHQILSQRAKLRLEERVRELRVRYGVAGAYS